MIQKVFITLLFFLIFMFGIRFFKKIKSFGAQYNKSKKNEDNIVDLEKDPNTDEYKPKK
mgnify:CR=1 FL=1